MKVILLKDITSSGGKKKVLYGKKNDLVKIISESRPALIVEGKTGRFPVNEKDVREL